MKGDNDLEELRKIIIDAGHGGSDPGAVYYGRQEKDDVLKLALEVGRILAEQGYDIFFTRIDDSYDTPLDKAMIANRAGGDYFISLHRNAMPMPNTASGVESLVFENSGISGMLAENINSALQEVGYTNLGVRERPGLIVLRRTQMPAVLVEAGFIDSEADNQFFDRNFYAIAQGIANGIMATVDQEQAMEEPVYYQVQVGAFPRREDAERLQMELQSQGFPAYLVYEDGYYKTRAGAYLNLDYAVHTEQQLKQLGYPTYLLKR